MSGAFRADAALGIFLYGGRPTGGPTPRRCVHVPRRKNGPSQAGLGRPEIWWQFWWQFGVKLHHRQPNTVAMVDRGNPLPMFTQSHTIPLNRFPAKHPLLALLSRVFWVQVPAGSPLLFGRDTLSRIHADARHPPTRHLAPEELRGPRQRIRCFALSPNDAVEPPVPTAVGAHTAQRKTHCF